MRQLPRGIFASFLSSSLLLVAAPQLRLSTTTLGPIYVQAGSNGLPQMVNAFNIGDGSLNLTISSTAPDWLSGSLGQPTTCSTVPVAACIPINITLNTSGLPVGNYTEYIVLSDPNSIDAPAGIAVKVQVNGAPPDTDFYVTPNSGAVSVQSDTASLVVNTTGSVISTINTSDNRPWLAFSQIGNQVTYNSYLLKVTSQVGQPEGNYSGTVILSGSPNASDNRNVNVNLHVTSQPLIKIPASPVTFSLVQGQAAQTQNIPLQNIGLGNLSISGASAVVNGGNWLTASRGSDGASVDLTAAAGSLNPGSYYGTFSVASNAANTSLSIPVRLNVSAPGSPAAYYGGVVDAATFAAGQAVAAGSIATIFGSQLSSQDPAFASGFPLPTTLGGVQVLMNGTALPIIYADAGQVNVQVPFNMPAGPVLVQVNRDGQPGNRVSVTVDTSAPRLFTLRSLSAAPDGMPWGVVVNNSDKTLALPANLGVAAHPARPGDLITIYAVGLGAVSPPVNTGDAAPSTEPLARTVNPVQVQFGGGPASVTVMPVYSGLAPSSAGLYQLNVPVPLNSPTGAVPLTITTQGHLSNVVDMAIASQ